jgi:phosphatidylinositol alpha-1,6-mannosyltransferase
MNLLRLVARPVTAVIAPSRELQEATARIRKAAVYIPNGVDPGTFSPADEALRSAARQRLGLSASQVILCPRRLVYKNGVDRLIEALPRIVERAPNAHAILAGGGPEHEALAARASSLGVVNRISFLGNVPHTGMSDLYAASDVVTIPSRLEATSLAALEAAACGLPVVATRVGGLPEVVQDSHTGYLVAEDDSTGLADAISRLLIDTSLSHRLGTRARSVVLHKFSWDEIARQTEEVYSLAADRR